MANFTTENNTYCFRTGPAFLDTNSLWIFRTIDSTTIVQFKVRVRPCFLSNEDYLLFEEKHKKSTESSTRNSLRDKLQPKRKPPKTRNEDLGPENEDPPPPTFFFSYFILFGLEFAKDLKLTIILLFVIFFIHCLNLLRFIECLTPSLLIKARKCEHKCLDPADGSSCYGNPLHHSGVGRSTKNGIISSPLYV